VGSPLPDDVVPIVRAHDQAEGLAVRLGPATLVAPAGESTVALVPAPSGEQAWHTLRRQLLGRRCVISLPTSNRQLATSLRIGTLAARLLNPSAAGARAIPPLIVAERLVELVLHRDPALTSALIERELAALDTLREGTRERLTHTFLAWLAYRGERNRVAAALHIHPQTVAYRLTTLRRLFGEALTDPDRRFALELALRAVVSSDRL
jgi:PucR C-terminal helix-turn-helix domain